MMMKKETISVKTFKAKKNCTYQYMQCDNAYDAEHFPYCKNTIQDGQEYLMVIRKYDNGCTMRYDYCEGCMRAKFSEEEIEKARGRKSAQAKENRVQTLVDEIRSKLKTYDGNDKEVLSTIETSLDEIVAITNERTVVK